MSEYQQAFEYNQSSQKTFGLNKKLVSDWKPKLTKHDFLSPFNSTPVQH